MYIVLLSLNNDVKKKKLATKIGCVTVILGWGSVAMKPSTSLVAWSSPASVGKHCPYNDNTLLLVWKSWSMRTSGNNNTLTRTPTHVVPHSPATYSGFVLCQQTRGDKVAYLLRGTGFLGRHGPPGSKHDGWVAMLSESKHNSPKASCHSLPVTR